MRDRILGVFLRELTLYRRFKPYVGKMGFPALEISIPAAAAFCCSVSIPSRGLWVFPLLVKRQVARARVFQSLVGVYGFSRLEPNPTLEPTL